MYSHVQNPLLRGILTHNLIDPKSIKQALEITWDCVLEDMLDNKLDSVIVEHRAILYVHASAAFKNNKHNLALGLLQTLWVE